MLTLYYVRYTFAKSYSKLSLTSPLSLSGTAVILFVKSLLNVEQYPTRKLWLAQSYRDVRTAYELRRNTGLVSNSLKYETI